MTRRSAWPVVCIKDVCESIIDCVNKTAPTVDYETPYKMIRTTNVKDGWINLDAVRSVEAGVFARWNRRATPRRGDVILTREAPLGEVGMLRGSDHVFLGQRLVMYRADPQKLDNRFLLYTFRSDYLQGQIRSFGSGATVEHMRVPDAEKLLLRLPPLAVQRRIGDMLSAYDDLIENNTRRIRILEEMAQRIYREWFVDFRFPGNEKVRMVESELGPIPKGWTVATLGDVAGVNQHSIKPGAAPEEIHYIDIASVSTGRIDNKVQLHFSDAPGRARRIVLHGDVIWSTVRPNRRSYALILWPESDLIVSTGFAVLTAHEVPYSYLYFAATTDSFADYLANHATGSAYPAVNAKNFEKAEILVPPKELLASFHSAAADMMDLQHCLHLKNANLRNTRNLLLPKLISGEISVEALEAAATA